MSTNYSSPTLEMQVLLTELWLLYHFAIVLQKNYIVSQKADKFIENL